MADPRQQLLEAVNALYRHPDDKVKKQASTWLEQWQQSLEAWNVSDAVLHDPNTPVDAQYFCAQTLRTKVQRDFEELPGNAVGSLRDSLMELLLRYAASSPMVRVQLCLALAAMAAHVPSSQWGPGGIIQWLMSRLDGVAPETSLPVMLEMLVVLPEEARGYSPSVRPERRRQLEEEIANSSPMALEVLTSCLSQPGTQVRARVLEAFASWLTLRPGCGLPGAQLEQHPLVTAALEGLQSPETFDEAVDALVELIYSAATKASPDRDSMPLIHRVVPAVIGLIPRFAAGSKVAQAEREGRPTDGIPGADSADDEDIMKGMARLFAEIGEAFTPMIASGSPDAIKPVEALLEVAGHPDDDICAMSFNFWHHLARQLNSSFSVAGTSSPQESEQVMRQRRESFYPAYTKLVSLIRGRVRFPEQYEALHEDEKRDFKAARYAVADTLLDAAGVLGADRMLQLLIEPLHSLRQEGNDFDWRTAEAALYCIKSVSKAVTTPSHPLLLVLFQGLPQLPAVPKLQYTAALTLGAYADWAATSLRQSGLRELMPQLLQMLTTALSSQEASSAASLAFRDICKACGAQLGAYLEALVQLYQRIQGAGALNGGGGGGGGGNGMTLDEEDVQQIMEAVALIVSSLPEAQRRAALNAMLAPVVQPLQQALQLQRQQQQRANGTGGSNAVATPADTVLPLFDRLTVIFRYVKDPGAVTEALIQVWPMLEAGLQQNIRSASAVERLCRAPRYALRTAGKLAGTGALLPTMMAAIPQWFAASRHSCFLYLASELVKVFGDVPRYEGALAELLGQLLELACQGLQKLQQFNEDPDVADDTFLLAARVLSYSPKLLLSNARLVGALLDAAAAGILVQHREACESVLTFLARLFEEDTLARCSKEAAANLQAAFLPRAPAIFRLLLAGAAGALPPSRLLAISDALAKLLKATQEQGLQWLTQAVGALPEEAATAAERERLLSIAAQVAGKDQSKSVMGLLDSGLHEMSELVRRNRRSLEAAQNALLPAELQQTVW